MAPPRPVAAHIAAPNRLLLTSASLRLAVPTIAFDTVRRAATLVSRHAVAVCYRLALPCCCRHSLSCPPLPSLPPPPACTPAPAKKSPDRAAAARLGSQARVVTVPPHSPMQSSASSSDAASQRPSSQPRQAQEAARPAQKPHPNGCTDVKLRLTKEQHDILEAHFQAQHKPSTSTKKGFAEALGVPLDKINNWFQNRRAKVKQDFKKHINQYSMSMGLYGTPQMPILSHYPRMEQPIPQPVTQDFFPMTADISPTSLPVQSIEGPSALELGPQLTLQPPYDSHHSLRSIPEAERSTSYHPDAVMHSFMAATAGASYMQSNTASLSSQEPAFSYDSSGTPNGQPDNRAFSTMTGGDPYDIFSEFPGFEYSCLTASNTTEALNSVGSLSAEPSPFSSASTATTQSSSGPNASSVTSIASLYSGWTDDQKSNVDVKPTNESFEQPYSFSQASASDAALPFWESNDQSQIFPHIEMCPNPSVSAQSILSSPHQHVRNLSSGPIDFDGPAFGEDALARRNSSTSNLASNVEAIHIQHSAPNAPQLDRSSIAARRQKRPAALNSNTLRSSSYTSGMPSPESNNDHNLRRIRSSGISNAAGRVQKPNPGSAQRSPLAQTFADAAASPKFARAFSSSNTTTLGQVGSLAPPTPQTPNDIGRFPYWQSNPMMRNHSAMSVHNSPESLAAKWAVESQSAGVFSSGASRRSTPLDLAQTRAAHADLCCDTPPQSAPATQQTFPCSALMQPSQMGAEFYCATGLLIAQPKPFHFRRPSLPEPGFGQFQEANLQYTGGQFGHLNYDDLKNISLSGITHNVPFAPPVSAMPDFLVHQYSSPQGTGPYSVSLHPTEAQPKSYVFANQGPHDFSL